MIVSDQSCKETKSPFWAQRVKMLRALRKVKFVKYTDTKEKTSSTNSPYAAFKGLSFFLFIHLQNNYDLDILTCSLIWMTILVLYRKPTLLLQQVHQQATHLLEKEATLYACQRQTCNECEQNRATLIIDNLTPGPFVQYHD